MSQCEIFSCLLNKLNKDTISVFRTNACYYSVSMHFCLCLLSRIISACVSRMLTLYKFAALWLFLFVFQPFHPH